MPTYIKLVCYLPSKSTSLGANGKEQNISHDKEDGTATQNGLCLGKRRFDSWAKFAHESQFESLCSLCLEKVSARSGCRPISLGHAPPELKMTWSTSSAVQKPRLTSSPELHSEGQESRLLEVTVPVAHEFCRWIAVTMAFLWEPSPIFQNKAWMILYFHQIASAIVSLLHRCLPAPLLPHWEVRYRTYVCFHSLWNKESIHFIPLCREWGHFYALFYALLWDANFSPSIPSIARAWRSAPTLPITVEYCRATS